MFAGNSDGLRHSTIVQDICIILLCPDKTKHTDNRNLSPNKLSDLWLKYASTIMSHLVKNKDIRIFMETEKLSE